MYLIAMMDSHKEVKNKKQTELNVKYLRNISSNNSTFIIILLENLLKNFTFNRSLLILIIKLFI